MRRTITPYIHTDIWREETEQEYSIRCSIEQGAIVVWNKNNPYKIYVETAAEFSADGQLKPIVDRLGRWT